MSLDVFNRVLDLCQELGIKDVRLTGGEPTIHPEFEFLLKKLTKGGLKVRLITNGLRLIRQDQLKKTLQNLDMCWISTYGPSESIHQTVAQGRALSLNHLVEAVGEAAKCGFKIGLSVLIVPGSTDSVPQFLDDVASHGVRLVRLVPLQPDGRANVQMTYVWKHWPAELANLTTRLKTDGTREKFDSLTLNSPFSLEENQDFGNSSCLLIRRRMWSVVPNGDIYPCCFTVYEQGCKLGNVLEGTVKHQLMCWHVDEVSEPPCRGLKETFWGSNIYARLRCPISNFEIA